MNKTLKYFSNGCENIIIGIFAMGIIAATLFWALSGFGFGIVYHIWITYGKIFGIISLIVNCIIVFKIIVELGKPEEFRQNSPY